MRASAWTPCQAGKGERRIIRTSPTTSSTTAASPAVKTTAVHGRRAWSTGSR
ncbi:hypothetical protein PV458_01655 [Streptomyces sp. MN03-5084-2B]|nr:hypothetical protein [Streptomyces sp. MN03-5084-2B]